MNLHALSSNNDLQRPARPAVYHLLSFLLPALVFTAVLAGLGVTPFGSHDLAITDAHYYLNGELFFSRLLRGQENWLYSLNNGLGANNWSQTAWGAFNIGGVLALFATVATIPTVFTWICVVNVALCGLTMYLLLSCVHGHSTGSLLFAACYAMTGFNMVNCYQVGFFQGPQLLPLMVLGLVLLWQRRSPVLYVASLAVCAFLNFYFAFHLCVLSAILFVTFLIVYRAELAGNRWRLLAHWAVPSLIGGLLAAPMWLTALKAYTGGGRMDQTTLGEYSFTENMPFIRMFAKLFSGANSTNELVSGMPNVFCGVLVLALAVLYFLNKNIEPRRRRAAGAVLGVYLLTFYVHAFTLVMHGGTHTNWFPYRYSYVFSFLLICLAAEEFRHLDEIALKDVRRCGLILLGAVLAIFSVSYEFMSGTAALLDLALLVLMGLAFWMYRTKPEKAPRHVLALFLLLVTCINLYANAWLTTRKVRSWELDLEEYDKNTMVSAALIDAITAKDGGFFRMEKDFSESDSVGADPLLYNYNGVSHSGPAERMFVHKGLEKLGVNWFDMRHWYEAGAPAATDALLGLKYIAAKADLTAEKGYERRTILEGTGLYQNPNALSVAILADGAAKGVTLGENVFENLNSVWRAMTGGSDDVFTMQDDVTFTLVTDFANQTVTSAELRQSASASGTEEDGEEENYTSYMAYTFTAERPGSVYVFDTSIPDSSQGLTTASIRYVGTYEEGDTVEGKFPISANIGSGDMLRGYCVNQVFAYADDAVLARYAAELNGRKITFDVVHENDLTGTFTASQGQRILFTLPWDEGWTCTVDGQKVPIDKTWDLFMSVEVPAGTHSYEMHFVPAWMGVSLALSGAALIGLAAWLVWEKKRKTAPVQAETPAPSDEEANT